MQNFTNAILKGEKLIAPGTDGIYELTLSNAAYLSNWIGNKEITLPFNCDDFDKYYSELKSKSKYNTKNQSNETSLSYSDRWNVNW